MPVHDWAPVPPKRFHPFHQRWATAIADTLNGGLLPAGYYALQSPRSGRYEGDVVGLESGSDPAPLGRSGARPLPTTRFRAAPAEAELLAERADRIDVLDGDDRLIAMIEIVSPGNKHSRRAISAFVDKSLDLLYSGVNLLIFDLLPPTPRDPHGIHRAIWDAVVEDYPGAYSPPPGEPLTLVSYLADAAPQAFIEPSAVGAVLPDVPLFLDGGDHVTMPTERTYNAAWHAMPPEYRRRVLGEA